MQCGKTSRNMYQELCFCCRQQECTKSCCGIYAGFSDKLNSVDGRSFTDIILTDDDAQSLLNSEYRDLVYLGDDGLYRIATAEDGVCCAYRLGRCLINDLKPTICKCFPLYLDIFIGLCSQKECIAVDAQYKLLNFRNELEPLLNMCEFWITYYRKQIEDQMNK